jgi:OFA family oxalate/formate antiporter-like MFS transporter
MRIYFTLVAAALAMLLLGAIYAYGVLLPVLMADFGWSRGTAALPHSVLLFVYAVGMAVGGAAQDRVGVRAGVVTGGLLFGGGLLLASTAHGLGGLIGWYGVLAGLGFGSAYVACVSAAMHSLPKRRGLAAGMIVGAFGLGSFFWAPLAQRLLPAWGWSGLFFRFGLLAIIALPLLGLFIRRPKHAIPDGEAVQLPGVSLAEALRSRTFWLIFSAYVLVTAVGLMLLAHLVNFALGRGITAGTAAWLVSAAAAGSGIGRFVMGWASDRIGRLPSLVGASVVDAVLLTILAYTISPTLIFVLAVACGLAFGTWLSLYGPTATDLYGLRYAGAIYGALYLSYGIGGLVGPSGGGALADAGGYRLPFLIGAGLCLLGALLFYLVIRQHPTIYRHPSALEEEYPG